MTEEFLDMIAYLPDYLGWHILLSLAALAVGLAVSIPLGVLASRRPKIAEYLLGAAGVLQTVPTLALLVLMVPILGGTIGFAPAFVALTLYSILPRRKSAQNSRSPARLPTFVSLWFFRPKRPLSYQERQRGGQEETKTP